MAQLVLSLCVCVCVCACVGAYVRVWTDGRKDVVRGERCVRRGEKTHEERRPEERK